MKGRALALAAARTPERRQPRSRCPHKRAPRGLCRQWPPGRWTVWERDVCIFVRQAPVATPVAAFK